MPSIQLGSDSSAPPQPNLEPDDNFDDEENLDTAELPDDLMETSAETLSDPQAADKSPAQRTTGSTALPAVPEQALVTAPSSSRVTSAVFSKEPSTSYRGYIGFPAFDELDEEK